MGQRRASLITYGLNGKDQVGLLTGRLPPLVSIAKVDSSIEIPNPRAGVPDAPSAGAGEHYCSASPRRRTWASIKPRQYGLTRFADCEYWSTLRSIFHQGSTPLPR